MPDPNETTPAASNREVASSHSSTPSSHEALYEDLKFNKYHRKPLASWQRGIVIRQRCHIELSVHYDQLDRILNTFSLTLTALSSSAIFASANPQVSAAFGDTSSKNVVSYVAGIIAVVSTILQAVHRALQHVLLAEQNKQATVALTKLRFRLEFITGDNLVDTGTLNYIYLNRWAKEYNDALESAPLNLKSILKPHAKNMLKGRFMSFRVILKTLKCKRAGRAIQSDLFNVGLKNINSTSSGSDESITNESTVLLDRSMS